MREEITPEKINIYRLRCMIFLMSIQSMQWSINYLTHLVGFSIPMLIYLLYGSSLLIGGYVLVKGEIFIDNFAHLLFAYSIYVLAYILTTTSAKRFFSNVDLTCIYVFFLPLSVFVIGNIDDWKPLFNDKICLIFANSIIVVSFLSKLSGYNQMNYMSFSYGLLPLWGIVLVSAFYYRNKIEWLFVVLGIIEGLIYGARGSTLWLVLCFAGVFLLEFKDEKKIKKNIFIFCILVILGILAIDFGLPFLLQTDFAKDSYFLQRLQEGSLTDSAGRNRLYDIAYADLRRMGTDIRGVFYDRTIMPGNGYAHNFILEIYLDFGWIIGTIMLIGIILYFFKSFIGNTMDNQVTITYLISVLFLRYFVSGSIFDEGNFIILIFSLHSLLVLGEKYKNDMKKQIIIQKSKFYYRRGQDV